MYTILIISIIYIISFFGAKEEITRLHKERWTNLNPDGYDILMILFPLLNTVLAISYCGHLFNVKVDINKFFKIPYRPD